MKDSKAENLCEEIVRFVVKSSPGILKKLTCCKLASMYDINRSYLSSKFKEYKGLYLKEYLKRIKMLKSALLMQERRDLTVKQISEKFGYINYDYFIKSFKQFLGITPGKFKKLIVKMSQ